MKLRIVDYQNELMEKFRSAKPGEFHALNLVNLVAGSTVYRLDSSWIDFVGHMPPCTRLPCTEEHIIGTCYTRGRVLVVMNFNRLINQPEGRAGDRLFVFKDHDIALCGTLASIEQIEQLKSVAFSHEILGRFASHFPFIEGHL